MNHKNHNQLKYSKAKDRKKTIYLLKIKTHQISMTKIIVKNKKKNLIGKRYHNIYAVTKKI